ncbi:MAG: N-acetyltransferase family protein [Acidimicrobiales bacterium]
MTLEAVRRAAPADLARLTELAELARQELSTHKGGAVWAVREGRRAPIEEGIAADLSAPERCVVVGEFDGYPVGYGVVRCEPTHDGGRLGVVSDLYVEPEFRGLGVGETMMLELVAWCEAQGCRGVDSIALPGDRDTKNFFESFGLVARAIVVHRALGPRDG